MTTLISSLVDLGLSDKEAELYMALLPRGQAPASILAKALGQPRSSTRFTLEQMVKKGIITEMEKHSTSIYIIEHPEKLEQLLAKQKSDVEFREKKLHEVLDVLKATEKNAAGLPMVTYYEGFEEVSEMNVHFMENYSGDQYSFSGGDYARENFPELIDSLRKKQTLGKNIQAKILRGNKYKDNYTKDKRNDTKSETKFLQKITEQKIGITIIQKVVYISVFNPSDLAAVKIESSIIAKNFKEIFQEIWKKLP